MTGYSPMAIGLRNLRHLYEQMVAGFVKDCESAANGLLSPAIAQIEVAQQRHDEALADLRAAIESEVVKQIDAWLQHWATGLSLSDRELLHLAAEGVRDGDWRKDG